LQSVSFVVGLSLAFSTGVPHANKLHRYKPDVNLRFITEELGFESDIDAAQFIIDYQGQHLLEERNAQIQFLTGKAGLLFEEPKKSSFARVDIKGQI
jgi:hypothetical protein